MASDSGGLFPRVGALASGRTGSGEAAGVVLQVGFNRRALEIALACIRSVEESRPVEVAEVNR